DGAIPLELGLVSREGWALVDDSKTPVFTPDGWLENRQSSPTHDLYFFGHGTDYQGALNDFFAVSGRVPMIPRWALGNWWSRYWEYSDQDLLNLMDEFAKNNIPLSV
ncbi:MAG TPA: glycoside hydrolase family 31 protein, partial [Aggregatilineales bacterium]|nr:glycoside hydrolase family 31 protein [Aggregatilineales bacterium]